MEELYGVQYSYSEENQPENIVASPSYPTFPTPATGFPESAEGASSATTIRDRIAAHPLYPRLLQAYIDCQKVGAPPEVAKMLDEIRGESDVCKRTAAVVPPSFGVDPELDHFMETYCDILRKFKSDLSRPFDEATVFLDNMRTQLSHLCDGGASGTCPSGDAAGSSEDLSRDEIEGQEGGQSSEDRELKEMLLQKYSGYISTLKHEFSKNKKKGKLPKESRQILLDWWNIHYKWPYPSESDKAVLAVSTGLDPKQINNWFINQRKRHWKPSDDMQIAVMDSLCGPFFNE
ncbi:hypothetical protein SLA2020_490980 [Shorea laevis]